MEDIMQEKENVLEIIGNVIDIYNGKEVIVKKVPVVEEPVVKEPVVEETVVVEEPVIEEEVVEEVIVAKEEPKVDGLEVKEDVKEVETPVVEEKPQLTVEEMVAKAISEALKPYQDEITTLKEENKGLSDTRAFGMQGRPSKADEIDISEYTVESIYNNSKK